MIYRPKSPKRMWDSWLYEWDSIIHMYYLESNGQGWYYIGHAISDDFVHWKTLPSFSVKGAPGQWNYESAKTGMVVRHNDKFYLFVGSTQNDVQVYGVYTSDDLEHWEAYSANPVLVPSGPHYQEKGSGLIGTACWRDPHITHRQEDGCYHAVLTARLPESQWSHKQSGAAIGHARSKDLIHWECLEPIANIGEHFFQGEVPEVFQLDGKFYLIFTDSAPGGMSMDTASRDHTSGIFYMVADSYEGPYSLPEDSLLIGAGMARRDTWTGRTLLYKNERILYHHVIRAGEDNYRGTWALPKIVRTQSNGTLFLEYFQAFEKLETGLICPSIADVPSYKGTDMGQWKHDKKTLTGTAKNMGSSYKTAHQIGDLHLTCTINSASANRAGIVLRSKLLESHVKFMRESIAIVLDFNKQNIMISKAGYYFATGWSCPVCDVCLFPMELGKDYQLRCIARDEHFEVYIDNRWIFTTVIPEAAKIGDVEFMIERGKAVFSDFRLAAI